MDPNLVRIGAKVVGAICVLGMAWATAYAVQDGKERAEAHAREREDARQKRLRGPDN